tara:strand:+ start:3629 stop:4459 length:831 start_codon:yes stop_codon:yes gene_type:complete
MVSEQEVIETVDEEVIEDVIPDEEIPDQDVEGFETPESNEEQTEQLSSIDSLISRLDNVESSTKDIDFFKHKVNSELGRLENIQSRVDTLDQNRNQLATVDRIQDLERQLAEVSTLLLSSEMVDDNTKIALRERQLEHRLQQIENGRGEVQQQQEPQQLQKPESQAMWDDATSWVSQKATELGYTAKDIPSQVWEEGARSGSPLRASEYVLAWVQEQVNAANSAEVTATKKKAAGNGTPTRKSTTASIDSLVQAYGEGKSISADEKKRVMEHLGIR